MLLFQTLRAWLHAQNISVSTLQNVQAFHTLTIRESAPRVLCCVTTTVVNNRKLSSSPQRTRRPRLRWTEDNKTATSCLKKTVCLCISYTFYQWTDKLTPSVTTFFICNAWNICKILKVLFRVNCVCSLISWYNKLQWTTETELGTTGACDKVSTLWILAPLLLLLLLLLSSQQSYI